MSLNITDVIKLATPFLTNDYSEIKLLLAPKLEEIKPLVFKWFNDNSEENKQFAILITPDENELLAIPVTVENIDNKTIVNACSIMLNNKENQYINLNVETLIDLMKFIKSQKK